MGFSLASVSSWDLVPTKCDGRKASANWIFPGWPIRFRLFGVSGFPGVKILADHLDDGIGLIVRAPCLSGFVRNHSRERYPKTMPPGRPLRAHQDFVRDTPHDLLGRWLARFRSRWVSYDCRRRFGS